MFLGYGEKFRLALVWFPDWFKVQRQWELQELGTTQPIFLESRTEALLIGNPGIRIMPPAWKDTTGAAIEALVPAGIILFAINELKYFGNQAVTRKLLR